MRWRLFGETLIERGKHLVTDNKFILAIGAVAGAGASGLYTLRHGHNLAGGAVSLVVGSVMGTLDCLLLVVALDMVSKDRRAWDGWKPVLPESQRPIAPKSLGTYLTAGILMIIFAAIGVGAVYIAPVTRDIGTASTTPRAVPQNEPGPTQPDPRAPTPSPAKALPDGSSGPQISTIESLTKLGWTVVATANSPTVINFQNARAPLPDMSSSARYMKAMSGKINVGIIEASSLAGLSQLGTLRNIESLQLAGQFPDLSELRSFKLLQRLDLVGGSTRDLEPVGNLTQLRELILQQPHEKSPDLRPLSTLSNLRRLVISGLAVQGTSVLRTMKSLNQLDLTGTPISDLTGLRDLPDLTELIIDQRSIRALPELASSALKILRIRHTYESSVPVDLVPIGKLQNLNVLEITAAGSLALSPITSLHGLSELVVTGTAISITDFGNYTIHLVDQATIGELHGLKKLGLAWVDIKDTSFMAGLGSLEEVYVNQTRSLFDIRTLGTLQTLRSVQLVATGVVDISPLLDLRKLKVLNIQVTPARNDVIKELKDRGVIVKE